uniref:ATP synthase F0 subunit 8 n=1 Tax=Argas walkerae TaxID=906883 RepID=UPI00073917AE|nr:ATP synthase F0 subunit 8 [Argas walkerae]AIZ58478.1 ATP synthase F0 subunit 8 [Argas walkerae]AIZ58491.1 ATP synthase F0 subunit 8 [Argas walkerae]
MPQLFPMNWLLLSILLTFTIYFELNLIYFIPFYKKSKKIFKQLNLNKNWKW